MNATTSGVTRINRSEARTLALAEFDRFADLTASLTPDEWATDTDCVGWDVRAMVLHVLGSADAQVSPLVFAHQLRHGLPLNKEIDAHGIESIDRSPRTRSHPYFGSARMLYVNMGDQYLATIMYDTVAGRFYVRSWGDFVEKHR